MGSSQMLMTANPIYFCQNQSYLRGKGCKVGVHVKHTCLLTTVNPIPLHCKIIDRRDERAR